MNRQLLEELKENKLYPSISVLMPTHRSHPESQQDKIRLKNLFNEAVTRLQKEFTKKEIAPLQDELHRIAEEIDFNHLQDGLAVFVNSKVSYKFLFSFPVKERVLIDKTFAVRDLVFGYNRSQPYYALVIDEKNTRIFSGVRDTLNEVVHPSLPLKNYVLELKSGEIEDSSYNDRVHENEERLKNYLRELDGILSPLISKEEINFVLTGTERQVGLFREITKNLPLMLGVLYGNYGITTKSSLARLVWPVAKAGFAKKRAEAMKEIEKAQNKKKLASGINEVWSLAGSGRGLSLLTETKYSMTAKVSDDGMQITPCEKGSDENIIDDVVDHVIENVVSRGGRVTFFDEGTLEKYGRIAMILRY